MNNKLVKTAAALIKNNMDAFIVKNADEARATVETLLCEGAVIGVGGSQTLDQTGILELIKSDKYKFLDRYAKDLTPEDVERVMKENFFADYFICSANAITESGELVNVDGRSNRVAALLFGPENVIVVAGANKIVPTVSDGLERVKRVAAPKNCVRLSFETYCAKMGECVAAGGAIASGCGSEGRICCNYVISAYQRKKNRIKVILCEEPLGY